MNWTGTLKISRKATRKTGRYWLPVAVYHEVTHAQAVEIAALEREAIAQGKQTAGEYIFIWQPYADSL